MIVICGIMNKHVCMFIKWSVCILLSTVVIFYLLKQPTTSIHRVEGVGGHSSLNAANVAVSNFDL